MTLAPHLAELVYSAGAGERLVGTVEFSDYPPPVRQLPHVGDAFRVDYEIIAGLRPDLVLAWGSGNPPETLQRLRDLGLRVEVLEPGGLETVARQIEAIGRMAGTATAAIEAAGAFRARLGDLRARYRAASSVRVFVQLAERPYFTVTDRHFLGQGLRLCGGRNVFGDLPGLTAIVSLESIVDAAPEVIVTSDMSSRQTSLDAWRAVPAIARGHVYALEADLLSRPGVRILDGIAELCRVLDQARSPPATP